MKIFFQHVRVGLLPLLFISFSCGQQGSTPSEVLIKGLNLKRGDVISCGPSANEFGTLAFEVTGKEIIKDDFTLGVKMLHSFEYDEAEKVFARVIDKDPDCAMAYWGVAMSNFHPLWAPPTEDEIKKGAKAIEIAKSIAQKTPKEAAYIEAVNAFFENWETLDHRTRCLNFEKAMEKLYANKADKEAAVFYALSLTAAADPADKNFTKQKRAGDILNALYPGEPNHPGIVHYLIHTYDSPELAEMGLNAARKYASVAPSSAHALHMPSHIFTRLGLWDECISSNLASVNSAQCYAKSAGIKGHWDEEVHGLDYLVYAYLQKGDNINAKKQYDYLKTIKEIHPPNFKVAYAFASIPARYVLENRLWKEAANLTPHDENFSWENHQWQKGIIHFARLMGSVHIGKTDAAKVELETLKQIHAKLLEQKDAYKAGKIAIQIKTGEAWIAFKEANNDEALARMMLAADLEDKTEKSPVTPGEVIPARELLGDMLLQMNKPVEALAAYEATLKKNRNRFNGLYGAGIAAEKSGNNQKAMFYYKTLTGIASTNSNRQELVLAKQFLQR